MSKVKKPKNYLIIVGKGTIATTDTPKSLAKEWKVKQKEVIQLKLVGKKVKRAGSP